MSREQLQLTIDEKDHLIKEIKIQMKGLHEEKEHLNLKRQEAANKVV